MASLTFFNRHFTPSWRMAILALLAILFFTRLGFWQLERATEKKEMLATQTRLAKEKPLVWQSDMTLPRQYQRISIEGNYLPEIILLDNQHHQHQFGYHVLSPLILKSDKVVLIDRGWVAADITRQNLPECYVPNNSMHLSGGVYYPSEKNWVLGQAFEKKQQNVILVEQIDTKLIGQFLHKSIYPFIIRLDKEEAYGYVREWAVVAMPPERHYAYALQWFAMASVILILFIVLNLKKTYEDS